MPENDEKGKQGGGEESTISKKAPKVKVSPEFIAAKKRDLDIEVAKRQGGLE